MKTLLLVLTTLFAIIAQSEQTFTIPDINIQAIDPKGLMVSIPDSPGIQLFAFHGNVNQPIKGKEDGTINKQILTAQDGVWSFTDPTIQLKAGDIVYYWIFVQHQRLGFDKQEQQFSVTKLVPPGTTTTDPTPPCKTTVTKINGDKPTCANKLLFEDNFDRNAIDESKWLKEQYIVYSPDYEMVTYQKRPENCYLESKNLVLKATLRPNPEDSLVDLTDGCTSQNCSANVISTIPAPIIAGRVKSKFRFKYGKIEIRAQLPRGDWIFPELYLEPHSDTYGPHYASGRMWLAYARGNLDLVTANNEQIGNSVLYGGPVLGIKEPVRTQAAIKVVGQQPWGAGYHTYTLTWTPDQIEFQVDGENKGTVRPPAGAFASIQTNEGYSYASEWKTKMAPFDHEFSLILGIGVGGVSDFPDNSRSRGILKPWKNFGSKQNLLFSKKSSQWEPTWEGDNSALKIEYVRVWAL
ncbi:Gram-negative bacteria binding protein 3 [Carabus blaptoides fortunei]